MKTPTNSPIRAAVLWALATLTPCGASAQSDCTCQYDFADVTAAVEQHLADGYVLGANLRLVKDGCLIYDRAFGSFANDRVVSIASATKWVSAAAFMTLIDDGLLDLDDRVGDYIPCFAAGDKGLITLRQLWAHRSGFGDHDCLGDCSISLEQCVAQICATPLLFTPGTEFSYGGAGMQVAGRVGEIVTGQSWVDLFAERLTQPAGMTDTAYTCAGNPRVAGGMTSNATDYISLLRLIQRGGVAEDGTRIVSEAGVMAMLADQTDGVPIRSTPHSDDRRYGIGNWTDKQSVDGAVFQNSSQGAFGFSPWFDRRRGLIGVLVVQDRLQDVYRWVEELQQQIRDVVDLDLPGGSCAPNDPDRDRIPTASDNCPDSFNLDQRDSDADGAGDACDTNDDNDSFPDSTDRCPLTPSANNADNDFDGVGNVCDSCPGTFSTVRVDSDQDGLGNDCDDNDDGDLVPDSLDVCPLLVGGTSVDTDGDGIGNACSGDDDNDSVGDAIDCAVLDPSADRPPTLVTGLRLEQLSSTMLHWASQGPGFVYDVASGSLASLPAPFECVASDLMVPPWSDARAAPLPGTGYGYLVRARNACGVGEWSPAQTLPTCP